MKKFSSEIELRGHLIDSLILTKVFDGIMDHGGSFEVLDIQVGKKKKDESYAQGPHSRSTLFEGKLPVPDPIEAEFTETGLNVRLKLIPIMN